MELSNFQKKKCIVMTKLGKKIKIFIYAILIYKEIQTVKLRKYMNKFKDIQRMNGVELD